MMRLLVNAPFASRLREMIFALGLFVVAILIIASRRTLAEGPSPTVIFCLRAGYLPVFIVLMLEHTILTHTFFRSEEHTSELQSLMRISYAVFCLTKKQNNKKHTNTIHFFTNKTRPIYHIYT